MMNRLTARRTMPRRARKLALASGVAIALSLVFAALAGAAATFDFKFGGEGTTAGKFRQVTGLATNNATEKIYVADRRNHRIQVFNESGDFLEAWGYDVVASGSDDKPLAGEVQDVIVRASGGTFRLAFEGQVTPPLPYDASAGEVEAALDALSTIISAGGVTVSGGPGDATGENPYAVAFAGTVDQPQLAIQKAGLAQPIGTTLECEFTLETLWSDGHALYQWLANGQPIPGATSDTYTTTAADAGKAIQCETHGIFEQLFVSPHRHVWETNADYTLVGSLGSPAPPIGPNVIAAPEGPTPLSVGGPGGTLTCNAGTWQNSPDTYTYEWYVRYVPYGSPTTTASTSDQITLSPEDVAAAAAIQCKVTATNAAGSSTVWSDLKLTSPQPQGDIGMPRLNVLALGDGSPVTTTTTVTHGGPVFEICKANPPSDDICKAGVSGPGIGQFNYPRGIAVDNSPSGGGAVLVGDDMGARVQKFTPSGEPILIIGGRVNQTTNEHACLIASGDDCGVGARIRTNKLGFLRGSPCPTQGTAFGECESLSSFFNSFGNHVAVDPNNGNIYVNDPGDFFFNTGPIQRRTVAYTSTGGIIGQMFIPLSSGFDFPAPTAVAVDSESQVLVAVSGESAAMAVRDVSEFTLEGTQRPFPDRQFLHESGEPVHISGDPDDDRIWVVDFNQSFFGPAGVCGPAETISPRRALIAVDSEDRRLDCTVPQGIGAIPSAGGLVVTKNDVAFVSLFQQNIIKVFKLPQETAPTVGGISVDEIASRSAVLQGSIEPGFEETEVSFEFGTSPCSSATCTKVAAAETVNGVPAVPVEVLVSDLEPGTRYYYRAVAENPFGTDVGPERTFTTFPFKDLTIDPCANALARKQTRTAEVLDCRAYELASAGFTGGYDVISDLSPGAEPLEGFPAAGDRVLYAVRDGGIPGTGNPTNRGPDPYLATRGADGWTTKYVGIPADGPPSLAPFASSLLDAGEALDSFAFGGPDVCDPCFDDGSSGIPVRLPNGSLVQGMAGSISQPAADLEGYIGDPMSSNGEHLVFGSTSQFEPAGNNNGDVTIYDRNLSTGNTQVVSTLDDGTTMSGPGIGQLGISADGSRIVVGQIVSKDSSGNSHWRLYMHIGTTTASVELAPGTTGGVLYLGMSKDGSRVFYSTADQLVAADTDGSTDIYVAEVAGPGSITPELVSVGNSGPSNDDSCEPVGIPDNWNALAGDGLCNAVGFAGGAGVAGDGTIYFLSPELLAGPGGGMANEANLFVVRPGGAPEFVATIDSSVGEPVPPPNHPVVNSELATGLSDPWSIAVDQDTGDIYVGEPGAEKIKRFTASGAPANFTEGPGAGTNELPGGVFSFPEVPHLSQVAVDSAAGSPLNGAIYGTKLFEGVDVHSTSGAKLGTLTGIELSCGVTVDQSTGAVYVADLFSAKIWRFMPTSAPSPGVSDANYTKTGISYENAAYCQLAAHDGQLYAAEPGGVVTAFDESDFAASAPAREGTLISAPGSVPPTQTLYVDPSSGELYVNTGSKVVIFDSAHNKIKEFGSGSVSFSSNGIAVNGGEGAGQSARAHHAYAINGSNLVEFGIEPDVFEPIDDPAIIHAVHDNEVHRWGDFQTTPNGDFALLSSDEPLSPGYDNDGLRMVHRYDAVGGQLSCLTCLPTENPPGASAVLPTRGLGITEDGRAFFNSDDQLVLRDQNGKQDAYEWKDGEISLISTGFSNAPSSLLTVTNDGKNAFFFTRETLVKGDRNGETMKLYNAREGGGFFVLPESPPCAASDECHGPSSQAAPPPPIGSYRGTGGNAKRNQRRSCKKGFVRRKGKCVRRRCKRGFAKRRGKCVKKRRGTRARSHNRRAAGHGRGGSR